MTHTTVKIRRVGSSAGAILPREVLDELQPEIGDTLHLVRTERGFEITPFDPGRRGPDGGTARGWVQKWMEPREP